MSLQARITALAQAVAADVKSLAAAVAAVLPEAPSDGKTYGRKDAGWVEASATPGNNNVGYLNIPLVSASANTTITKAHAGGGLKHPSADTTARTFTIDSNANQSWVDGTAITIWNVNGTGGIVTITALNTMRLAGAGTTGSRTLARNGIATFIWDSISSSWVASGAGLS